MLARCHCREAGSLGTWTAHTPARMEVCNVLAVGVTGRDLEALITLKALYNALKQHRMLKQSGAGCWEDMLRDV